MDWSDPVLILVPILWVLGALCTAWAIFRAGDERFRRGDIVWLAVWPVFWIGVLGFALVEFFQYVRRKLRRRKLRRAIHNVNEEEYYNGE